QPPQAAVAVDEVRRDEKCPRRTVPPQNRPSMLDVVTIAVVEGYGRKRPPARTRVQPVGNRIERNNVKALAPQFHQDDVQKLRRDFEEPIRRELTRPPGPDMVKH